MDEGKPAQRMSAYLLVAAERHSPGWECDHHYSIALEQHLCLIQECSFVFRFDVLYHIVHYDQIIFCNVGGHIHLKEITAYECSLKSAVCKEFSGVVYLAGRDVYSVYLTPFFCKRNQVTSFSTSNLKNKASRTQVFI